MIKTKSARIISLALALMLAFSAVTFSACSGKSTSSTEATKKAETAATAAQVTTAASLYKV